ncbi:MAG: hypothetical protein ABJC74_00755 [Gemmatimonadota bacterium]
MNNKLPFVEPSLTEEASLIEITLVSGGNAGFPVIRPPRRG